jgi:hypothetical protein
MEGMSLRWRWSLVVVVAAIVLAGLLPQALLTGIRAPAGIVDLSTQALRADPTMPTLPSGCVGGNCGKTTPAAVTPALSGAALVALGGTLVIAVARFASRRIRRRRRSLPRGTPIRLFHPPQFSRFDPFVV